MITRGACKLCRHWLERANDPTLGECRRFPPTAVASLPADRADEHTVETVWPDTKAGEWCGEFSK